MKVKFYGTQNSLSSWKALVENKIGKKCEEVTSCPIDLRYSFIAHIDETDCSKLMDHWCETEVGHTSPWNHRVTFSKGK